MAAAVLRDPPQGRESFVHNGMDMTLAMARWGSSDGFGKTSCWRSTSCRGRSTSPHIADEAPDVDIGQRLCKQAWPERLNIYTGCF
ncbi:hypothetical protein JEQ12_005795 [Ovis aries]|uniref:Uncharacterized protein n=1 Tax=Ovis aries TaxID=9940 RepID=A0A836A4T3_SHEEP|nr:hypothetical protein JEQ12_005795 [Ovis aries]